MSAVLLCIATCLSLLAVPEPERCPAQKYTDASPTAAQEGWQAHLGQMLWVGFEGLTPEDPGVLALRARALAGEIGGCVISHFNVESPAQLERLTRAIKGWPVKQPFAIAVDQEGGAVQRLSDKRGFNGYPSAAQVAEMAPEAALAVYRRLAAELKAHHIDVNFGPSVDLALNPSGPAIGARGRSFGTEVAQVHTYAQLFIQAHRELGIKTAVKHFPGHGSAAADSHEGLTDVTQLWQPVELSPFVSLMAQGQVDSVMSAHLMHRGLDPHHPLSLSPNFLQQTLRGQLNFDGLVFSDELQMGAIKNHFSLAETVVLTIASSTDVLLFAKNGAAYGKSGFIDVPNLPVQVQAAVAAGLKASQITPASLKAAYARILRFKSKMP